MASIPPVRSIPVRQEKPAEDTLLRPERSRPSPPGAAVGDRHAADPEHRAASIPAALRQRWILSLLTFAAFSAVLVWAFFSEIASAVQVWSNSRTYGHAFFILPICLFLLFGQRRQLAALRPKAAPSALLLVVPCCALWFVGELGNAMVVKQLSFVALWQTLFVLVFGWQVARAAVFPLAYLYFAVPIGSSMIPFLQDITARTVVWLLQLTGMPVFLDGYFIEIPSGSFLVAEACSGVRYLIVSLALGVLASYLFFKSWRRRLFFIALSVFTPIIANSIRAYGIILLAHLSDYRLAVDVDHVVYGFIFLGIVMLILVTIAAFMRDRDDLGQRTPDVASGTPSQETSAVLAPWLAQLAVATLALGAVLFVQSWATAANSIAGRPAASLAAPAVTPPWQTAASGETPWIPQFYGTDATLYQGYERQDSRVDLYIGYYAHQREGSEAISDLNALDGENKAWNILRESKVEAPLGGQPQEFNRLFLQKENTAYVVWYLYWVGDEFTSSRLEGKVREIISTILGRDSEGAMIAFGTRVSHDEQEADKVLRDFFTHGLEQSRPLVQTTLAAGN